MALRITGSVIGEPITSSSTSATGMWTSQEVAALQKDGIWQIAPTFTLTPSASNVNEGASITVTLTTTGVRNGAVVPYVITGANVNSNDGNITGNFVIQNGSNTISFSANADLTLEGAETLTITAGTASANVTINDTSDGADAQFSYTTLLLHGDGTNNSQNNTFLDSSTNNFTITRNGNSTQGTFSPYGSNWSGYFDGTGDYLSIPNNAAFDLTGDFAVECWFNFSSITGAHTFIGNYVGASTGWALQYRADVSNVFRFGFGNTTILDSPTINLTNSIWYHLAVTRSGSSIKLFLNGAEIASGTSATSFTSSAALWIGGLTGIGQYVNGYISNSRIVKGAAVYTAAFTQSTTPLTAVSGTSLLTCQSNRFIDNSTNNFAITRNGDVNIQRFSPFSPTSAYNANTYGGAAYFDGTGDYLTVPTSTAFYLSSGNWTVEVWVYKRTAGKQIIVGQTQNTGDPYAGWVMYVGSSENFTFEGTNGALIGSPTVTVPLNVWTHLAAVKSGSTVTLYQNGVVVNSGSAPSVTDYSTQLAIGMYSSYVSTAEWNGYISNLRIVKGTAVYTSAFTPPTAPVTAISGTSLLCNFTNAGIYDNAMMSNLETVADSKISTAQSKFGGSSMYFDGAGDVLKTSPGVINSLGAGDFTIEGWVYPSSLGSMRILSQGTYAAGEFLFILNSNGSADFCEATTSRLAFSAGSFVVGEWKHFAIVRSGSGSNNLKGYINGTLAGTGTSSSYNYNATTAIFVGSSPTTPNQDFQGYIDDLRITKGYARYTSAFTPPTLAHGDK